MLHLAGATALANRRRRSALQNACTGTPPRGRVPTTAPPAPVWSGSTTLHSMTKKLPAGMPDAQIGAVKGEKGAGDIYRRPALPSEPHVPYQAEILTGKGILGISELGIFCAFLNWRFDCSVFPRKETTRNRQERMSGIKQPAAQGETSGVLPSQMDRGSGYSLGMIFFFRF